jgi:hypothetical protein
VKAIDVEKARLVASRWTARLVPSDDSDGACLLWTGAKGSRGHGRAAFDGSVFYVHRVLWVAQAGYDPAPLELDHLCRTPACARFKHLEPVDGIENVRRGTAKSAVALRTNCCVNGHSLLIEANVYTWRGIRHCRVCRRDNSRRRYENNPDLVAARIRYHREYRAARKAG